MKVINNERYYTISEVGSIIGKTRATLLRWYEYEREVGASNLPPYITLGKNNAKFFKESDIIKFHEFKATITRGDMAQISKKYNGTG